MEEIGLLDLVDDVNLFCLHYVYQPYINHSIKLFTDAWSTHPMRMKRKGTPLQIWIEGMINATSGYVTTEELYSCA